MKKLIIFLISCLLSTNAFALLSSVTDTDGSPDCYDWGIEFPEGSVTCGTGSGFRTAVSFDFAQDSEPFVTIGNTVGLSAERALTGTSPITITDNGANSSAAVGLTQSGIDHGSIGGLGDDDHAQYLLANGTRTLTADWDAGSFEIRAQTFESDVVTGTAPFTIASTTLVTNLNADLLDGTSIADFILETELDSESELEMQLTDVIDVFTNNDGVLDDDDLTDNILNDLSDVTGLDSGLAAGDMLYYNGTNWVQFNRPIFGLGDSQLINNSSGNLRWSVLSSPATPNLSQVLASGNDTSGNAIDFTTTDKATFNGTGQYIQGSSTTVLDIVSGGTINLTATTLVKLGGAVSFISATNGWDISSAGVLTKTGTANYDVDSNTCAFRAVADTDACLAFETTGGNGYAFRSLTGADAVKVYTSGELEVNDTNTGTNAGSDLCIGANNRICVCGTCN